MVAPQRDRKRRQANTVAATSAAAAVPAAFLIIMVHVAASLALHLATGAPPPERFHAEDEPA